VSELGTRKCLFDYVHRNNTQRVIIIRHVIVRSTPQKYFQGAICGDPRISSHHSFLFLYFLLFSDCASHSYYENKEEIKNDEIEHTHIMSPMKHIKDNFFRRHIWEKDSITVL
jgi:hypothetical protein